MEPVRTEVDGVPVFWTPGQSGRLAALLFFRVGQADERLAARGITHLVEHLALHGANRLDHSINGQVDVVTTVFSTEGGPAEVASFLAAVCASLHDLPTGRIAAESRLLLTEADGRGPGPLGPLLVWRYGAATYGLPGYEEFGVGHHTAAELTGWARHWFTRQNAALALIGGPPPAELRLDLPDGVRIPPPAPSSALPHTPAYFGQPFNGVAMGTVVPRGVAAQAYARLLGARLLDDLRKAHAISYRADSVYTRRDAGAAQIFAVADGLRESHDALVPRFAQTLDRLAEQPVDEAELAPVVRRLADDLIAGGAVGAAVNELLDTTAHTTGDLAGLTPGQVTAIARQARDSALLMVPDGRHPGSRYRAAPRYSAGRVQGRSLRSADFPRRRDRLIAGPDGVTHVHGPHVVTVRFAACETVLAWPDGGRVLFGGDGFNLEIEPTLWEDGGTLTALIDHGVPAERVVYQPPRPPERIPAPETRTGRLKARLRGR